MDLATIRSRTTSSPFVPFTLNLADGRTFRVTHPEFVAFPPEGRRYVIVFLEDDAHDFEMIDPMLVTSLQVDKPGSNGKSNGNANGRPNGWAGIGMLVLLITVALILFIAVGMPTGSTTPPGGATPTPGAANTTWKQKNPGAAPQQGVQGGGYLGALARGNRKARGTISAISAMEMARLGAIYELENGRYPETVEDLGYDATVLKDEWGTPLFFTMGKDEITRRTIMLVQSAGPDGIADNEDDLVLEQPMPF